MNILIEKLKSLLPTKKHKLLSSALLLLACIFFSFLFINSLYIRRTSLTLLATIGIGFGIYLFANLALCISRKLMPQTINQPQYFMIYSLVFAIEIFSLSFMSFISILISPYLFYIVFLICIFCITGLNIVLNYKMYNEVVKDKNKFLNNIKTLHISSILLVFIVWLIL